MDRIARNITDSRGLVFSERVLLDLVKKGLSRESAYGIVQRNAMKTLESGRGFEDVLLEDAELLRHLTPEELKLCFDMDEHLSKVNLIFERAGLE